MAMDMALIYEPKAAHAEKEMLRWWEQGQLCCRRIAQLQHSGDVSVSSVALSIHRIVGVGKDLWRSSITLLATLCAEFHSPSQPPGHFGNLLATRIPEGQRFPLLRAGEGFALSESCRQSDCGLSPMFWWRCWWLPLGHGNCLSLPASTSDTYGSEKALL